MKKITLMLAAIAAAFTMNAQTELFSSDFSTGDFSDFDEVVNSESSFNFTVDAVGTHDSAAIVEYDPALVPQDERLITSSIDLTGYETAWIEFNWQASYYWAVSPEDNYDLNVLISTDGGVTYTELWNESMGQQFESTDENFLWLEERTAPQGLEQVSLNDYIGMDVKIAFQYVGADGASGAFDDISIMASDELTVDYLKSNQLTHYTNNGILVIDTESQLENIEIYSILGEKVGFQTLNEKNANINIAHLQNGVYLAKVSAEGQTKTFKFIKK